jgi:hypothetical protein
VSSGAPFDVGDLVVFIGGVGHQADIAKPGEVFTVAMIVGPDRIVPEERHKGWGFLATGDPACGIYVTERSYRIGRLCACYRKLEPLPPAFFAGETEAGLRQAQPERVPADPVTA